MPPETVNTISQSTFVWSLLGSTVIATVVGFVLGWAKEFFQTRAERDRLRKERLYSVLRLNLMLMASNFKTRQEITNSRASADKKAGYKDPDEARMKKFMEDSNNLIDHWWELAKKVLKTIEENPQYIRDEDWPIIERLFDSYIFRKFITGEKVPSSNFWMYDDDIFLRESRNEFVVAIDELYKNVKQELPTVPPKSV